MLSTDRPDFTESTDTVPPGSVQLEGGILNSRHALESGPSRESGLPYVLARFGLTRFAELRWDANSYEMESDQLNGQRQNHSGSTDFDIGVKVRAWDERKLLPAFAVIAALSVPDGSAFFTSGTHNRMLELCWSKSLPAGFDAGGNVNFQWGDIEHAVSLSVGHKLGRGVRAYWETYRISPIQSDEALHWIFDTGITKQIGKLTQLDIEIGHTLNARTPLWFVGAGFALRFPGASVLQALNPRTTARANASAQIK